MMWRFRHMPVALVCAIAGGAGMMHLAGADEAGPAGGVAGERVDFVAHIQPVFKQSCYQCHGDKKTKGKLRLDSRDLATKGGANGAVIVPGNAKESSLVKRLRSVMLSTMKRIMKETFGGLASSELTSAGVHALMRLIGK